MSLPYFKDLGWEPEVITVDEKYFDVVKDGLLLGSIPSDIVIHKVGALPKKWTSKFGLGSLALRSLWSFRKKGSQLLKSGLFDLVYFSTTQFPVCILGNYWKKKFGIPYIIDMQDPWHSTYYLDKPKSQQPPKYWFSYRLNKYLEPIAMKNVDGVISVSRDYIETLESRYPWLKNKPSKVITFGSFELDFEIAEKNKSKLQLVYPIDKNQINLIYIGRGGYDIRPAIKLLFEELLAIKETNPVIFSLLHLHFIGTSYAPNGTGTPTIAPTAQEMDLGEKVTEYTDRIGFYQSIRNLQEADGLLIVGSNDASYTASKLYPYIMAKKPLLALFHPKSEAATAIKDCHAGNLITLEQSSPAVKRIFEHYLEQVIEKKSPNTNWKEFEKYTAKSLTKKQVDVFDEVLELKHS
ncbi:glycosyltransferase family 4 protein [Pedobacter sp. HDW13]|nr:glycosyltransferase family 4 protein [Pedobacter sp. HDW13]